VSSSLSREVLQLRANDQLGPCQRSVGPAQWRSCNEPGGGQRTWFWIEFSAASWVGGLELLGS